jgi:ATP-dependent RNA helicase DDX21
MKNEIKITGNLKSDFSDFNIQQSTIETLQSNGISSLFQIQSATYDYLYNGHDLIGRDRTGSGKTLAFCLPILERFRNENLFSNRSVTTKMLILSPTRELANQISTTLNNLKNSQNEYNVLAVYGGTSISNQVSELRKGVDIMVATPGRLIDLMERGVTDFSQLKVIVFDETDEMLKIGFQRDIETILRHINKNLFKAELQYLLFSATVPHWVSNIAREFMDPNYYYINMVTEGLEQTSTTVEHFKVKCLHFNDKIEKISDFISVHIGLKGKVIVFVDKKSKIFL